MPRMHHRGAGIAIGVLLAAIHTAALPLYYLVFLESAAISKADWLPSMLFVSLCIGSFFGLVVAVKTIACRSRVASPALLAMSVYSITTLALLAPCMKLTAYCKQSALTRIIIEVEASVSEIRKSVGSLSRKSLIDRLPKGMGVRVSNVIAFENGSDLNSARFLVELFFPEHLDVMASKLVFSNEQSAPSLVGNSLRESPSGTWVRMGE